MTSSYYMKIRINEYENQSIPGKQTRSKVQLDSCNLNSFIQTKSLIYTYELVHRGVTPTIKQWKALSVLDNDRRGYALIIKISLLKALSNVSKCNKIILNFTKIIHKGYYRYYNIIILEYFVSYQC